MQMMLNAESTVVFSVRFVKICSKEVLFDAAAAQPFVVGLFESTQVTMHVVSAESVDAKFAEYRPVLALVMFVSQFPLWLAIVQGLDVQLVVTFAL